MSMVSLPAGEVADLREAVKDRDALLHAARTVHEALLDVFKAINEGWWDIDHEHGCPEDDTCTCPGGVQGTAGLANYALNKIALALRGR
jgi:hypothetical protein